MKHTLVFHIIALSKKLQKAIGFKSSSLALSYSEASTLLVIDSQKETSQIEIAKKLHLEPPSIVSLIDKLEKQGLAIRKSLAANRRKYQIVLTKKGKAEVEKVKFQTNQMENFLKNQLSNKEVETFFSTIEKLTSNLELWNNTSSPTVKINRKEVKHELPGTKQYVAS